MAAIFHEQFIMILPVPRVKLRNYYADGIEEEQESVFIDCGWSHGGNYSKGNDWAPLQDMTE